MSLQPIGVAGHPSAWAIGLGIAIASGVTCIGLASVGAIAGWPWSARRWLTTPPQDDAAGDQTTGRVPSSGQLDDSRFAAAPEDLLWTLTVVHPLSWAALLLLKSLASCVRSDTFSGELATLTVVHPLPPALPPPPDDVHAASTQASSTPATS